MKKGYELIENCIQDISHRVNICKKVWKEQNLYKRIAEFRVFIFSVCSSADLIRSNVFEDFKKKRKQYFTDILERNRVKLCKEFVSYLRNHEKYKLKHKKLEKEIQKLAEILFKKIFMATDIYLIASEDGKCFSLWEIYNALKHSVYPERSPIAAYFVKDLAGYSGEMLIRMKSEDKDYYIHLWGGYVFPEGYEDERKERNETLVLIENVGEKICEVFKAMKEIF